MNIPRIMYMVLMWFCMKQFLTTSFRVTSQTVRFMGPTWGPPGSCRPQVGPMLAPWSLLSGFIGTEAIIWLPQHDCPSAVTQHWQYELWHHMNLQCWQYDNIITMKQITTKSFAYFIGSTLSVIRNSLFFNMTNIMLNTWQHKCLW